MSLCVHHYYPMDSRVIGDDLVARAMKMTFKRYFGQARFVDVPANDANRAADYTVGIRGENLLRTNSEADLVLIGGSNMLQPRKPRQSKRYPEFHWGVFADKQSLSRLAVPSLMVGMGTGSDWGRSIRTYSPQAAEEIHLLRKASLGMAVRDVTTVKCLEKIQVESICTGCPVTFLTERPVQSGLGSSPLIVSLPPHRILSKWSGRWFMYQSMAFVRRLMARGVSLVITIHEERDLEFASKWIPKGVPVFYTDSVDKLIDRYEDCCGVIGFRLHAALLAIGLGKPIVPVAVDWRGRAFIETFALQDVALRAGDWGGFSRLMQTTELLLDGNSNLINRLNQQKLLYLQRYHAFWRQAAVDFTQRRQRSLAAAS